MDDFEKLWTIVTDSDGHRWLVSPGGVWFASFDPSIVDEAIAVIVDTLNAGGA